MSGSYGKVTVDLDGQGTERKTSIKYEKIFVSGLQVNGNFKYQFIETALHDIDVKIKEGTKPEDITWIIFNHDVVYGNSNDLAHFNETAKKLRINFIKVKNRKEFINYINYKNINTKTNIRDKIKIKYLSIFGHGQTPRFTGGKENMLSFGYGLKEIVTEEVELEINFSQSQISQINYEAFEKYYNETYFYTCNTGTADWYGLRFAKVWADCTIGTTHAFQNARSNYIFINMSMDPIPIGFNLPGDDFDIAISDFINKYREVKNNAVKGVAQKIIDLIAQLDGTGKTEQALDSLSEEELDLLLDYIAETYGVAPSKDWIEKRKRSKERERVDNDGRKHGYSDKGSLYYPCMNNIADDLDIISKTGGEKRGYLTYRYSSISAGNNV